MSGQQLFSVFRIAPALKTRLHVGVDIKQIRRANMEVLIQGEKNKTAFARKVGTDPAYISQLLSAKTKANIGHRFARAVEDAYDLPHGWMDQPHAAEEDDELNQALADFAAVYKAAPEAGRKLLRATIEGVRIGFLSQANDKQRKQA